MPPLNGLRAVSSHPRRRRRNPTTAAAAVPPRGRAHAVVPPGETPEQAIVREVLEETQLQVRPADIIGVFGGKAFRYVYPNGDAVEYTVVLYLCDVIGHSNSTRDPETRSLRYFSEPEMPPLALPYPGGLLFAAARRRT